MSRGNPRGIFEGEIFGNLEVVGYEGFKKVYVICKICHSDTELWNKPLRIDSRSLRVGKRPCGCGNPVWTQEQNIVRIKRALENTPYSFEYCNFDKRSKSKVVLSCSIHNTLSTRLVTEIVNGNRGLCNDCSSESCSKTSRLGNKPSLKGETLEDRFFNLFKDDRYTVLSNDTVLCKVCEKDPFCNVSTFKFNTTVIKRNIPCRCTKNHRYTEDEIRSYTEYLLREGYEIPKFPLKWSEKFNYVCPEGHQHITSLKTIFTSKQGCKHCWEDRRDYGYYPKDSERKDYLYLLSVSLGGKELCYKVGRAFDIRRRLGHLHSGSVYTFKVLAVKEGIHDKIYAEEQRLLNMFERYPVEHKFKGSGECLLISEEILNEYKI